MDVRFPIPAVALILMLTLLGVDSQNQNGTEPQKNATSDATKECKTAKNITGLCVPRQSCDHGTPAIDFTLFATHDYIRPCAAEDVCCPVYAMVLVEPNSSPAASIDSDEDFK